MRRVGKLVPASWNEAFAAIAAQVKSLGGDEMAAIAGDLADCESMALLKDLMASLGCRNLDCRQDGAKLDPTQRASWLFNSTIFSTPCSTNESTRSLRIASIVEGFRFMAIG